MTNEELDAAFQKAWHASMREVTFSNPAGLKSFFIRTQPDLTNGLIDYYSLRAANSRTPTQKAHWSALYQTLKTLYRDFQRKHGIPHGANDRPTSSDRIST